MVRTSASPTTTDRHKAVIIGRVLPVTRGTPETRSSTRDPFSLRTWSTGVGLREGQDANVPSGSLPLGPECFSRYIRAAEVPNNFRLAMGISKFTGESKPEIWLEDFILKLSTMEQISTVFYSNLKERVQLQLDIFTKRQEKKTYRNLPLI